MAHDRDSETIASTHNTARFFVENRAISWMLLIGVLMWGILGYWKMPKRKDPEIPVRGAVALCPWPGVGAETIEQLVTKKIESQIAENSSIHPAGSSTDFGIRSVTLDGLAIVYVQLSENNNDSVKQFSDISLKLNSIDDLPAGAGPIQFQSDFGDTAALMLTIASPKEGAVALALRARELRAAIERVRETAGTRAGFERVSLVTLFPQAIGADNVVRVRNGLLAFLAAHNLAHDIRPLDGSWYCGLDALVAPGLDLRAVADRFITDHVGSSVFPAVHPDASAPVVIRDPAATEAELIASASDKYTYHELDRYSDLVQRTLETLPDVEKVSRSGVLPEWIQLAYSQRRLASYGIAPSRLAEIVAERNIDQTGGIIDAGGTDVAIHPTGEFTSPEEIGDVMVQQAAHSGAPLYLRDLVDILPGYENPPQLLNFYTWRGAGGRWNRSRAITLGVFMRHGAQIDKFGADVDAALDALRSRLPEDLVIAHTSDQPRQVRENLDLLMHSLYEAIALVILVSWLGFWEWRSALLIALSIPTTLAMTFGMMYVLGIDLQQVSIATLIIALGLLVDDPVVAGDAIKHELGVGRPRAIAAWLGPTKLGRAILFATITNVVAYLPFLMLSGDTGKFLYSLPIVMTCALVASRIVSMTFVPHLGYYLMRPGKPLPPIEYRRTHGITGWYYRLGEHALTHRKVLVLCSFAFLGAGLMIGHRLRSAFFPEDVQYLAYVDAWLRNGASLSETNTVAREAEAAIRRAADRYGRDNPGADGKPRPILRSITSFVGGGGPRFWFSEPAESEQHNYAQLILEIYDKEEMPNLVGHLQRELSGSVPGAYLDVRQLLTNPVQNPIEIHVSGQADVDATQESADIVTLRAIADQVKEIVRSTPGALRVRTDWMEESPSVQLPIDSDRANLAGVSNADIARSTAAALSGWQVGTMREGDSHIPIIARLRQEERAQLADVSNLYIYPINGGGRVPIDSLVPMVFQMKQERIVRRDHFRTMTVVGFPAPGLLPSQIMRQVMPRLRKLRAGLPPSYRILVGGEQSRQEKGFGELGVVLGVSATMILIALVIQFNSLVKPWLVFTAVPYGAVGAVAALWVTGTPFGFMAFLGIASLIGVIVSHVIVLFEFIEERQEMDEDLIQGLLDAGIERLRPVMVTVGATILALFPLAMHGGPLWRPLCFAQIGGLSLATLIELILVKSFYAIFVADLKILKWGPSAATPGV
jgi:multidrug efflux pump subunit AcrB